MTDGERGATVSDGANIFDVGVFPKVRVADLTGAGDAFGSGFVAGLMESREKCEKNLCRLENISYALRRAMANATAAIEEIGSAKGILSLKEFKNNPRWRRLRVTRHSAR